jgi:hypothetical protein
LIIFFCFLPEHIIGTLALQRHNQLGERVPRVQCLVHAHAQTVLPAGQVHEQAELLAEHAAQDFVLHKLGEALVEPVGVKKCLCYKN